jgi:hypothetical protein
MFQRSTRVMVRVLGLVLVTVAVVGLAQADDSDHHPKRRFVVLPPDNLWVLDTTTSLRWQKTPSTDAFQWTAAETHCTDLGDGARLPEVKELISLVDYDVAYPALPAGHPFQNVQRAFYWSATTFAGGPTLAWIVRFDDGLVGFNSNTFFNLAWCVR